MKTQIQTWLGINCGAVLFLCLLVLHGSAIAQTSDSLEYFPCDPGDQWLYYVQYSPTQGEFKTIKIDSVLSHPLGKLVYMSGDEYRTSQLVVDTSDGFIYAVFSGQNPESVDSLQNPYRIAANLGDYWSLYPSFTGYVIPYFGVSAQFDTSYFGERRKVKEFSEFGGFETDSTDTNRHDPSTWFSYFSEQYACGLGMVYRYVEPGEGWFLVGAVIDGDTVGTLTAVNYTKNNVPRTIQLNQNYPNPFNPTTAISYQLSAVNNVTLRIYDVLGREVKTLVNNERQAPGTYTVIWNGTNEEGEHLSSAIYFYRLTTNDGILTKKAVYLK